jgi:putative endonuclease
MSKGIVYILQDDLGRYYIGSTNDLNRRLTQHSRGQTPTTYRFKNPKPAFSQEYSTLAIARKIELKIKRLKRKDYIERIIRDGFIKISV